MVNPVLEQPGEIQNEPFGALKRDTGQVADEPDLVVKYKMSPSGH